MPNANRTRLKQSKVLQNIPQPGYTFVGRKSEIDQMLDLLSGDRRTFITIDGIGGVGKTALAVEIALYYVHRFEQLPVQERFEVIAWASAKQSELRAEGIGQLTMADLNVNELCNNIASVFGASTTGPAYEQSKKIKIVHQLLITKRTLVILDNLDTVTEIDSVIEFLSRLPWPTQVIVTTRHRTDIAYRVPLTGMSNGEARQLINQECGAKRVNLDEDAILELISRTGGLPLAIRLCVGLMGFSYSPAVVLKRLSNPKGDLSRFCFEGSMEHLRSKNQDAYKMLIGLAIYETEVEREKLAEICGMDENMLRCDDALVDLVRLSLVNCEEDIFSLQPLTREFVLTEKETQPNAKTIFDFIERRIQGRIGSRRAP